MPPRSSRRARCYKPWCWGTRGLQASSHPWAQHQPQSQACPQRYLSYLHQLRPPILYRSVSNPDRGAEGRWPHWWSPCPQRDPCPWNQNVPPTSTWSLLWGLVDDRPCRHRGKVMVRFFVLLVRHRFLISVTKLTSEDDVNIHLITTL